MNIISFISNVDSILNTYKVDIVAGFMPYTFNVCKFSLVLTEVREEESFIALLTIVSSRLARALAAAVQQKLILGSDP